MADEAPTDTFTLTLGGREILFRKVTPGMYTAMRRYMETIQAKIKTDLDEKTRRDLYDHITQTMLEVVDSRFMDPADREWVSKEMMLGRVEVEDVLAVVTNGDKRQEPVADDADPPVKTVKKTPAKKTANATRAKR